MDNVEPTAEEIAAEQEALKLPTEDELKAKIIEDFGFDEEADADKISKLVAKDLDGRKKLSSAIGAKIKHRKAAQDLLKNPPKAKVDADGGNKGKQADLSTEDIYGLMEAKVPKEDIGEVRDYANLKGLTIAEALNAPMVKSILADKAEQRRTAAATQGKGGQRGAGKVSGETLLEKARKGELPEGDADIEKLAEAHVSGLGKK